VVAEFGDQYEEISMAADANASVYSHVVHSMGKGKQGKGKQGKGKQKKQKAKADVGIELQEGRREVKDVGTHRTSKWPSTSGPTSIAYCNSHVEISTAADIRRRCEKFKQYEASQTPAHSSLPVPHGSREEHPRLQERL